MLKKENRIVKRTEFLKIKETGTIKQSPFFGLAYLIDKENVENKIGFIISKKVSKKAVTRNKIRRQISEIIYNLVDDLPKGFIGIFLVRSNILDIEMKSLQIEIEKVFENVKKNNS